MQGIEWLVLIAYFIILSENNQKFKQINKSLVEYVKVKQCLLHTDLQYLISSVMGISPQCATGI